MRAKTVLFAGLLAGWTVMPRPAAAVDLALVLLTDVSKSMDSGEHQLVKDGYRTAFADPEVIAAIVGNRGGVAVAYVEFSGADEVVMVRGWEVLTDAPSARTFGEAVASAPRSSAGNTALAGALRQAMWMLQEAEFGSARLVIDVASDHPTDGGRSASARDAAVEAGITINALPIIDDRPLGTFDGHMTYMDWRMEHITEFYRQNVIGGPGSSVIEARSFEAFGEALKRKLLLELISSPPNKRPVVPMPVLTAAIAAQ